MDLRLPIKLLPKQLEFVNSQHGEVLYSGAYGAAKSVALCVKTLLHAQVPGNRVMLGRKTLVSLKKSTLTTLLEGDSSMPAVLPARYPSGEPVYDYRRTEGTIYIHGGGRIELMGLDEPEKLGSMAFGAAGIDEVTELTLEEYRKVSSRVRLPVYGGRTDLVSQVYGATNPDSPTHWAYEHWFGPDVDRTQRHAITTRSFDNPFLPERYRSWLNGLTGQQRDRYVEGKWIAMGGAFFEPFQRDLHCLTREGPWRGVYGGVDDGCTNPAVLLPFGMDEDDRIHFLEEWYETGHTHTEIADRAEDMTARLHVERWFIDPAAAGLREEFYRRGLPVGETDNDRVATSRLVYDRLKAAPDGRPRLTMDPSCRNLANELESVEADPNKNEPRKGGMDHAVDACRYGVTGVDKNLIGANSMQIIGADSVRFVYEGDDDARWE